MKKYLSILFVVAFVLTLSTSFALAENKKQKIAPTKDVDYAFDPNAPQAFACPQEAKLCADGTSVGRTGPNCEFAKCPSGDFEDKNLEDRFFERDAGMLRSSNQDPKDNVINAEREKIKEKIEAQREDAKQKMENLKLKIQTEKNKGKAKVEELRIIGREEALKRFDIAITRLNTWKDNINTKIEKLATQGINTKEAKAQIVIAETKIVEAKAKVAEASALLAKSLNELSKEDKTKLKQLTKETQTLVKEAHLALNEAVRFLKEDLKNKIAEIKTTKASVDDAKTDSSAVETNQ